MRNRDSCSQNCGNIRNTRHKMSPSTLWQLRWCEAFAALNYPAMSPLSQSQQSFSVPYILRKQPAPPGFKPLVSVVVKGQTRRVLSCVLVRRLMRLSESFAVLALDPHPVHGELFASIHLQPSVHKVLHFLKPRLREHLMQLIWNKKKHINTFYRYNVRTKESQ